MPVNSQHPEYVARVEEWLGVRDAMGGERVVKQRGQTYLPAPPGMEVGSSTVLEGGKRYDSTPYDFYRRQAEFPEKLPREVEKMLGVVHGKPPKVLLPESLRYLEDSATKDGRPLSKLWFDLTEAVLLMGRYHLVLDVDEDQGRLSFCTYVVESLINWRASDRWDGRRAELAVLREVTSIPDPEDDFLSEPQIVYREMRLVDGVYFARSWTQTAEDRGTSQLPVSPMQSFEGGAPGPSPSGEAVPDGPLEPVTFRGRVFDFLPIYAVNALETSFDYGPIPSLPLVRRLYSIYRRSAQYNRSLYVKSDPQIVLSGILEDEIPTEIGGESVWHFIDSNARARYLDIDGDGIPMQRTAIRDDYQHFSEESGELQRSDLAVPESGAAISLREGAKQLNLRNLVVSAARSMESALRDVARMAGEPEDSVQFQPDLDFATTPMTGQELLSLQQAREQGAPMSDASLHEMMVRRGATNLSLEEEREQMVLDAIRRAKMEALVSQSVRGEPDETSESDGDGDGDGDGLEDDEDDEDDAPGEGAAEDSAVAGRLPEVGSRA